MRNCVWNFVYTWLERNSKVFCCSSMRSLISFLVLLVYDTMVCWRIPNIHNQLSWTQISLQTERHDIWRKIRVNDWNKSCTNSRKHLLHKECFSSRISLAVISHGIVHLSLPVLYSFWKDAFSDCSENITGSSWWVLLEFCYKNNHTLLLESIYMLCTVLHHIIKL